MVIRFSSTGERGTWAIEHWRGTGHDRWWLHDGDLSRADAVALMQRECSR
jgi:hypothetical protein